MDEEEQRVASGDVTRLRPLPTGFEPLDDILNGGLRPGELLVIGGAFGVGKTIWGLQVARNAVVRRRGHGGHLRLLRARPGPPDVAPDVPGERGAGHGENALTLRKLAGLAFDSADGSGLMSRLQQMRRYAPMVQTIRRYADRLVLVKASGDHSTLDDIRRWVEEVAANGGKRLLLVVDYLQKIPVNWSTLQPETEVTTHLTQGLKEMAMSMGIRVIAIAASDRAGLKAKRMRLADLRGSSAVQYEADIGLILNNKWSIISREHLVYNPTQAEAMRNWVVMSVEKNRAGRNAVDMEFPLDAAHFRIVPSGSFVRERLVDEKVVMA